MEQVKVVVHDGIFHADEVFGVAMLKHFLESETVKIVVERTRLVEGLINDDKVILLDVGGQFNPSMLNFDHHQDRNLPASNLLILEHLYVNRLIEEDDYNSLLPLMKNISDFDTNSDEIHNKLSGFKSSLTNSNVKITSNLISGFNRSPKEAEEQFNLAVDFAINILINELYEGKRRIEAERIYDRGIMIGTNVIEFDSFCMVWKERTNSPTYAIFPDGDNWKVLTKDSSKYPLPEPNDSTNLVFLHQNKFIAVFDSYYGVKHYVREQL